jgi:hypothetical protein
MRRSDRSSRATLTIGLALLSLVLVILSPFGLGAIGTVSNANWVRLANIGQTYGAVSALLAALALGGVAISIFSQIREARHGRWEAGRARHFEIMRLAIEDPFYRQVFSLPGVPEDKAKLVGYINLLFEYWSMMWEFGDLPEELLRNNLVNILRTSSGSLYWRDSGEGRLRYSPTKRQHVFNQIANEVYLNVCVPEITSDDSHSDERPRPRMRFRSLVKGGLFMAVLATIGAFVGRRMHSQAGKQERQL